MENNIYSEQYLEATAKKVIRGLKFGIIENGETRKFDILDYYELVKVPNYIMTKYISANYDRTSITMYQKFNTRYLDFVPLGDRGITTQIYNDYLEVDCKKDKTGMTIVGTGRVITKEEKEALVNYLISNNIPVTTITYKCAFEKCRKGIISLEHPKQKVLV